MKAGGVSKIPMIACAVTDLPDPDSPRMASVSPWWSSNDTPLIALATPSRVRNSTCNSSTSSKRPPTGSHRPCVSRISTSAFPPVPIDVDIPASLTQSGIESVADDVAQHDEGEHGEGQEHAGEQQHVRRGSDQADARGLRDLDAPGDGRRLQSDPKEGQRRLDGDVGAEVDRRDHNHRCQ